MSTNTTKSKSIAKHVKSLAPDQRRRFNAQVRQDRDLMVEIWKENSRATRHELEQLYWERGGDTVRFDACLNYASTQLLWEVPER